MAKVSDYGAVPNGIVNCAAAINQCMWETGVVEFDEGTYIIGTSSTSVNPAELVLYLGYPQKYTRGVRFIGKGKGKTILKFADNNYARITIPYGSSIFMFNTYSPGDDGTQDCGDCIFQGITFDGNFANNYSTVDSSYKTVCGVRIIGRGNLIEDCEFRGFGVGAQNAEAFALQCYLHSTAADNTQGAVIRNCSFNNPGPNSRVVAPGGYIEANSSIAVGGNGTSEKYATGVVVENCDFTESPFNTNQRSPLHGISPVTTRGAVIRNNTFTDFQGQHIYVDSYKNFNLRIENNSATLCPQFISFVVQNWPRLTGLPSYAPLIASFVDVQIENNTVGLAGPASFFYNFNNPPLDASFFLYQYDRDVTDLYNPTVIPGFKNIALQGNTITNSNGNDIIYNNGGYWPSAGAFQQGQPSGPVPPITDVRVLAAQTTPAGARAWNYKPVTLQAAKAAKPVVLNKLKYKVLNVGDFALTLEAWAGASRVFAVQNLDSPNQNFSLRLGQNLNVPGYVIAVKWVEQGSVKRYKLWTNGYEVLSYPLYNGEIIPGVGAQLEYWSTSYTEEPFAPEYTIQTDILESPNNCCDENGTQIANGLCIINDLPNPPGIYPIENFSVCPVN